MLKVSIVGATGYTGEELLRLLFNHKDVEVVSLTAKIDKPEYASNLFSWYRAKNDLLCHNEVDINDISNKSQLVFLALPHRVSMEYAPEFLKRGLKVIDLSADYRLPKDIYKVWYGTEHKDESNISKAVYGLPELYRREIKKAQLIANPGCYPTSIILASAPLLKHNLVDVKNIIADSKSGVTGAGRKPDVSLSFGEVDQNLKAYKINKHQHMPEINKIMSDIAGKQIEITFVPHLIPMRRGILSTVYFESKKAMTAKYLVDFYKEFYKGETFVRVLGEGRFPQIQDVVRTNYCDLGVSAGNNKIVVVSCIDNLTKGAAGQAIQNMNIICGFDETEGFM